MNICSAQGGSCHDLLSKGLEEECYTGTADGEVVGLSHRLAAVDAAYGTEPDSRNVEHRTRPHRCYLSLARELLRRRRALRHALRQFGDYTIVPGATLARAPRDEFHIADEDNAYYRWIRAAYGSRVVTAGLHINIGIAEPEALLRAYRVLRLEAPLYLALSACSPFLDNAATGLHSTRWQRFPRTPRLVPFFADHAAFKRWVGDQLACGAMQSHRHLWLAARPNGPASPCVLDRLELRICDDTWEPALLIGVVALLEARVQQVLASTNCDPLALNDDDEAWQQLAIANEDATARDSLDATITWWRDGRRHRVRDLLDTELQAATTTMAAHGVEAWLAPIARVLGSGNTAQQWLNLHRRGKSIACILATYAEIMREREELFAAQLEPAPTMACACERHEA